MQLLVSVRSAAEVGPALNGGADIIDAKEPGRGSLGPVSSDTLAEILALVPAECPFSVALGDLTCAEEAMTAIGLLGLSPRRGPTYVKLGFSGVRIPESVTRILASAVAAVAETGSGALVVAVAYADAAQAQTLAPELIPSRAAAAGAAGVLLDTYTKEGTGLLGWLTPHLLRRWVAEGRSQGMLTALAGSLTLADIAAVSALGADVVGVRGAACEAGRRGDVREELVRALRQRLDGFGFHSGRGSCTGSRLGGETRDGAANPVAEERLSCVKPTVSGGSQGA